MKLNPKREIIYRVKLAKKFLEEAEKHFKNGMYRNAASASQLSVENAVKAVIATKRIPSWAHDPSNELLELMEYFSPYLKEKIKELALIARETAPVHSESTYGKPLEGLTPWDIFTKKRTKAILENAGKAVKLMEEILSRTNHY